MKFLPKIYRKNSSPSFDELTVSNEVVEQEDESPEPEQELEPVVKSNSSERKSASEDEAELSIKSLEQEDTEDSVPEKSGLKIASSSTEVIKSIKSSSPETKSSKSLSPETKSSKSLSPETKSSKSSSPDSDDEVEKDQNETIRKGIKQKRKDLIIASSSTEDANPRPQKSVLKIASSSTEDANPNPTNTGLKIVSSSTEKIDSSSEESPNLDIVQRSHQGQATSGGENTSSSSSERRGLFSIDPHQLTGKIGLERMMTFLDSKSPPVKGEFEYKTSTLKNYNRIFLSK